MTAHNQLLQRSEKGPVRGLAFLLNVISGSALMGLMLITCVDVFGRYVLQRPLVGSVEMSEVLLGVLIFTALPTISWRNEQVAVDILDSFVPPLVHLIRTIAFNVLAAIALYFVGERIMALGARALKSGEVSEYLHIPVGAVLNFFGVMCWITALALLTIGLYRAGVEYQLQKAQQALREEHL